MPLEWEWVADQARVVLEDVPVAAIKITLPGTVATVPALAELVADYAELPLVLELPALSAQEDEPDDAHLAAALELLVPYASTVVLDPSAARRLIAAGIDDEEPDMPLDEIAALLCGIGAQTVLFLGAEAAGPQEIHALHDENGVLQREVFERAPRRVLGFGATVSAALAAGLAQSRPMGDAVREALQFAQRSESGGLHMGMGALVPDRMFWARNDDGAT